MTAALVALFIVSPSPWAPPPAEGEETHSRPAYVLFAPEFAATGLFIFDRQFGPFDALPFGGELSLRILLGARF